MNRSLIAGLWVMLLGIFMAGAAPAQSPVYYADATRPDDTGNGLTWATAKKTLQAAIDATPAPHQVWAKKGTYGEAITMKSGVALYGGFAGTENQLGQRDARANLTLIDHSLATSPALPPYGVTMDAIVNATVDGFVITAGGGRYIGVFLRDLDGTDLVANCIINDNYNGGIKIDQLNGSTQDAQGFYGNTPKIRNCVISGNGYCGISCNAITTGRKFACRPEITNCVLSGNIYSAILCKADRNRSSGPQSSGSSYAAPVIAQCTIADGHSMGGLFADGNCSAMIRNTIFYRNQRGVLTYMASAKPVLTNCLFFSNFDADNNSGDYSTQSDFAITEYPTLYASGEAINENVPGCSDNLSGNPRFLPAAAGSVTAVTLSGSGEARRMRLYDANAHFTPGALAGRLVTFGLRSGYQFLVLDNTTTSMLTLGFMDDTAYTVSSGSPWRLIDYHLQDGSPAVDQGFLADAPATDFEGDPRPGADGLVDIGADEATPAFQPQPVSGVSRIYVDLNAPGSESGLDWQNACHWLQDGLYLAQAYGAGEIWVAAGTYHELIRMTSNLALYGGFSGWAGTRESALNQRDVARHPTILEGDNNYGTHHVVTMDGLTHARLDGFTIQGGWARLLSSYPVEYEMRNELTTSHGGGIICRYLDPSCTIVNCIITRNMADGGDGISFNDDIDAGGGGIFCQLAPITIEGCTILGNGSCGIFCSPQAYDRISEGDTPGPTLRNCSILGNQTEGLRTVQTRVTLVNCLLACQDAGLNIIETTATLTNCTFFANNAGLMYDTSPIVTNALFTQNGIGIYQINYQTSPSMTLNHALFHGNAHDIFIKNGYYSGIQHYYDGARSISQNVAGTSNILDGDPRLLMDGARVTTGTWTGCNPNNFYFSYLGQTILSDNNAHFIPGSLVGRFIYCYALENDDASLAYGRGAYVVDNSATTVTVVGSLQVANWSLVDGFDLHLGAGSAAIDAGAAKGAPATDLDGKPRPVDIPGLGQSGPDAYDLGAYEYQSKPLSLAIDSTRLDFGEWDVSGGATAPRNITLTNAGLQPLTLGAMTLGGADAADFSFSPAPSTAALDSGATRALTLVFDPSTAGIKTALLSIASNDPDHPLTTVTLTGRGTASPPRILTQPAAQSVNSGADAVFSIAAAGTAPLSYTWSRDGKDLSPGGRFTLSTAGTLTIKAATVTDEGLYACRVGNAYGTTTSQAARLQINPALAIASAHGSPTPAVGMVAAYTSGTQLVLQAGPSPLLDAAGTTRYTCTGWTGTGSVPASGTATQVTVTLTQDSSITWTWKTEYYLQTTAEPAIWGTVAPASGWCLAGQGVALQATPAADCELAGWEGSLTGTAPAASLLMNGPKAVTARFRLNQALLGTVRVSVVPEAAGWSLADSTGGVRKGTGSAVLAGVPSGAVRLTWTAPAGYDAPKVNPVSQVLAAGGEAAFTQVFITTAAGARRTSERLLAYLLGQAGDASGLDLNKDGKVDIGDALQGILAIPLGTPGSPYPASGTAGMGLKLRLNWADCDQALGYDLYVWEKGGARPATPTASGLTQSQYDLTGGLESQKTYQWQVIARRGQAQAAGPVWTFSTN